MKIIYQDNLVTLIKEDAFFYLRSLPSESIDVIVADPPYFLSNGGFSNSGGKMVSVNKGIWDQVQNISPEEFYRNMLQEFTRILAPNGTLWLFGTLHNIYILGYLLPKYHFQLLNNISWQKSNPAPNLSRRMFTHSTETILWSKKEHGKQFFNYDLMRQINNGKQMKDVWTTATINRSERRFGKHPTQKPLALLLRIIQASATKEMLVLDPFTGSGTTNLACKLQNIKSIGIDNSSEYLKIAQQRISDFKNERIGKIQ
ncbi:site-specific DNA-methyltransferase [Bombilactobacillus bombi]|uniref:Methyltransferase n=1 Tax=Bombilactobacillus bombi TaxID=1303590 RepID=A0A3R6UVZ9_9LACO|nr:site-specific DNA-methyltransferase [Bombilactobacillus bombi]RHW48236.1 site-specific DNA-methyltransferase [Bombilactobacillus bombi]